MSDLTSLTAVEIASAVAERKLSANEVTRAFLARIDALNPTINAICTPNPGALAEADEIDHRLARGEGECGSWRARVLRPTFAITTGARSRSWTGSSKAPCPPTFP